MSPLLTDAQIDDYQRDGVVLLRELVGPELRKILAEGVAQNLTRPSKRTTDYINDRCSGERFFYDACVLGEVDAYDRLMLDSPMAEAVARLMGSASATLFYISVFVRSAGVRNRTPWHQDQSSWAARGDQACSAWLSLDSVSRETALEFVRGSHRWQTEFQRPEFFGSRYEKDDWSRLATFPDIESHREDFDIAGWEMEPGDCLIFHGMTAHGGSGNLAPGTGRRSLSVQWLGDDARFRILPGGDDPPISEDLLTFGVKPGDPITCAMCPKVWPRA